MAENKPILPCPLCGKPMGRVVEVCVFEKGSAGDMESHWHARQSIRCGRCNYRETSRWAAGWPNGTDVREIYGALEELTEGLSALSQPRFSYEAKEDVNMDVNADCVLLKEVGDILNGHGDKRCALQVHEERGCFVVTMSVPCHVHETIQDELDALELFNQMRYLSGLCQVRAFAAEYGIDREKLDALLPVIR